MAHFVCFLKKQLSIATLAPTRPAVSARVGRVVKRYRLAVCGGPRGVKLMIYPRKDRVGSIIAVISGTVSSICI